jgi:hypothetical protein
MSSYQSVPTKGVPRIPEKRDHIQKITLQENRQPSLFDAKMSKRVQSRFVDIQASIQNQFYPLPKNPQVNCIEPFTRGGDSSVLQIRDRCTE